MHAFMTVLLHRSVCASCLDSLTWASFRTAETSEILKIVACFLLKLAGLDLTVHWPVPRVRFIFM